MPNGNYLSELKDKIKNLSGVPAAVDVGGADLRNLEPEMNLGYPSAVAIIMRLSRGVLAQIDGEPTITYFAHYRAVNRALDGLSLKTAQIIESDGYRALPIPASQSDPQKRYGGVFPHKTAAHLSGLGWIGKNALFIHHEWGPGVRLATVLCDADFSSSTVLEVSRCGSCTICKKRCPAMAIEGVEWHPGISRSEMIDVTGCSQYMKEHFQGIGRGSVCGLCVANCPYSGLVK